MEDRPLWAPWRIEYILSKKDQSCFLCGREKPSDAADEYVVLARRPRVFVILNAFPYNSGHLMVVPYQHVGDLSLLDQDTLSDMMSTAVDCKRLLQEVMRPDGFNIGVNQGKAAGAGVEEHVHLHVVPRWSGDTNFMPILGAPRVVPQALRDTADILRKHWPRE